MRVLRLMRVRMAAIITMVMRIRLRHSAKREPRQPQRQPDHENTGYNQQPWLGLVKDKPVAKPEARHCDRPDNDRVADCSREAEDDALKRGAANGNDEGRHQRFGMPGLQRVQRSEQYGYRQVKPGIGRAKLNDVLKVRHGGSQIFGNLFQFADQASCGRFAAAVEAMIDMIVNKLALGTGNGGFHGMHLLRDIETGPVFRQHGDDRAQMALRPLQARNNCRMALMLHILSYPPG